LTVLLNEVSCVVLKVENARTNTNERYLACLAELCDELRRDADEGSELLLGDSEFRCGIIE
jgi:hypothetical protein